VIEVTTSAERLAVGDGKTKIRGFGPELDMVCMQESSPVSAVHAGIVIALEHSQPPFSICRLVHRRLTSFCLAALPCRMSLGLTPTRISFRHLPTP